MGESCIYLIMMTRWFRSVRCNLSGKGEHLTRLENSLVPACFNLVPAVCGFRARGSTNLMCVCVGNTLNWCVCLLVHVRDFFFLGLKSVLVYEVVVFN